jgi:hypothetical protein
MENDRAEMPAPLAPHFLTPAVLPHLGAPCQQIGTTPDKVSAVWPTQFDLICTGNGTEIQYTGVRED